MKASSRILSVGTLAAFCCLWTSAFAQFSGNDGPDAGTTEYYTYFLDVYTTSPGFNLSGGTAVGETHNGNNHSITVQWGSPGSGTITFIDGISTYDTYNITIGCPAVANPSSTFSYTQNCGNTVITRNSSPPSGITWYWQSATNGTSTASSGNTYQVSTGATYYLTARNNTYTTCWSSGYAATSSVTVNPIPGTPSVTNGARCGTGTVGLSASPGANGTLVRWYAGQNDAIGTQFQTGTSYTTPSLSSTTMYYVCTYNSTTACESARTAITATINSVSLPGNASSPVSTPSGVYGTESVSLSASGLQGGETFAWYTVSTGGSAISSTQSVSTTSTFYVARRITATTCESATRVSVTVPAYSIASITPSSTQYLAYGGSVALSANAGFTTYQWVRNDTAISGATLQSYTAKRTGVYKVDVTMSGAPTHRSPSGVTISGPTSQALNMVSSTTLYKEGLTLSSVLDTLSRDKLSQSITYMDGMGRAFQSIAVAASPDQYDLVSATGPEKQGLAITSYLPYVSTAKNGLYQPYALRGANGTYAASDQYYFYQNAPQVAHDTKPYAKAVYRQTPDARAIESGAPGVNWQPDSAHTVRSLITFNATSDSVRKWTSSGDGSSYYAATKVVVETTTDENGNQVKSFVNPLGQLVLKKVQYDSTKWLKTYYVYDDYGRLKYQVPPRAVELFDGTPNLVADTQLAELIYRYDYDDRDRVIAKKIPGATDEEYIVYDNLDRVVLTQDGNLKAQGKWMFIKYDFYGRPAYSGLFTSSSSRATLQTALNNEDYTQSGVKWYEYETSATHNYSNQAYPRSDTTVLSVNYYDHYDFNRNASADYTYDNAHLSGQESSAQTSVRGSATGSRRRTVDAAGNVTSTWLWSVIFYGSYDRVIQTLSNNHLYSTLADKTTMIYNFAGQVLKSKTTHAPSSTVSENITSRPEYDHAGRVLRQYQTLKGGMIWNARVGVSVSGNTISKTTASSGAWNAGAFSANGIVAGTDGVLEFKAGATNNHKVMGLSDTNPGVTNTTIDYGIYAKNNGTVEILENNSNKGNFGAYTTSDLFAVERVGTTVYYKKNGTTFYTSTVSSSTALYVDCSFYHLNASFTSVQLTTETRLAEYVYNKLGQVVDKNLHRTGTGTYLQSVDYRYNIRGWLTSINNSQLTNDGTLNNDTGDYFGMELSYQQGIAGMGVSKQYNGNVSAVKWRTFGTTGAADQRSFKYSYDKSDRLTAATFQAYTGSAWTKEANTLDETMTYDFNGNIKSLVRKRNNRGLSGTTITSSAQTIDDLAYVYQAVNGGTQNSNVLVRVNEAVSGTTGDVGFKNGASSDTEFAYNAWGSMTKDDNKDIDSVKYNFLGKPRKVYFGTGKVVEYSYDAAGTKLSVKTMQGGTTEGFSNYVGGFVYEGATPALSFFSSPGGRVVKNGTAYEYQYSLADNQGNTRIIFTSVTPESYIPIATLEGDAGDNAGEFSNVSNVVSFTAANHTAGGSKVVRMNQGYAAGPSKSIKVYPGDKVDAEVWTYYESATGYGTGSPGVAAMVTAIATGFGGASGGGGESGSIYNGVNSALGGFGLGGNAGDNAPAAYLNYILFDQQYKVLNMGWIRVPTSASFAKQKINLSQVSVTEAGYIFVYLSYEDQSNNYVYFDDFKVTHTKSNLIQGNEYYPFGMQTANSWTREAVTGNNYLANGGTELNYTTQLYDLMFRNYDPALGRMSQVDPLAAKYPSASPYNYSLNNPVFFSDPNGADVYVPTWLFNLVSNAMERKDYGGTISFDEGMLSNGGGGGGNYYWAYYTPFKSNADAFKAGSLYNFNHNSWANTYYKSYEASVVSYIIGTTSGFVYSPEVIQGIMQKVKGHEGPEYLVSKDANPIIDPVEAGNYADPTSFNLVSANDSFYGRANFEETIFYFNPSLLNLSFRFDVIHISVSNLMLKVNEGKDLLEPRNLVSLFEVREKLAYAWDLARIAVYKDLKSGFFDANPQSPTSRFADHLNHSIKSMWSTQSAADYVFNWYDTSMANKAPISDVRLIGFWFGDYRLRKN